MIYKVELKPKAQKYIKQQIPKIQRQLTGRLENLSSKPRPHDSILLKANEKLYRIDIGNYRIVYQIDDSKRLVMIAKVGHRKDIYKRIFRKFKVIVI